LKYPCNVHGNIYAEKSIHLKILEWTSMVHGHINIIHSCIFIVRIFRYEYFMNTSTRGDAKKIGSVFVKIVFKFVSVYFWVW